MIEAMKQALEFFESGNFVYPTKIATDLRQAIKELESQEPVCPDCKAKVLYECVACSSNNYPPQRTEQEPVAWRVKVETKLRDGSLDVGYQLRNEKMSAYDEPLYTHPPQRKPLTDEQIGHDPIFRAGVRFAEASHGIKE
jgi:hypothetical protein